MLKQSISISIIIIITVFSFWRDNANAQESLTAYQIMEKVDQRLIPTDQKAEMTMNLIDKRGKIRSRSVKTYRMGDEKQIMWFIKPADVKGSSFLRISHDDRDDDMWIYLPAFGKIRRIASSAKNSNFMGSDFTYEDMETPNLNDFDYILLREEQLEEKSCWVIERIPRKGISKNYSKMITWIWKEQYTPVREELYDRKGNLRKIKSINVSQLGKYWIPDSITMENLKTRHKTELIFEKVEVDTGIDEQVFESSYMTRIH